MGFECKNIFNSEAENYDNTTFVIPYYKKILDDIVSFIPFPNNAKIKVLDLGCGTGTLIKKICNKFPNSFVYAVDFSTEMLSVARKKNKNFLNIRYFEKDIINLNLDEFPYFDLVVSTFVLHNYKDLSIYSPFLNNIYNLLSANGIFIMGDLIKYNDATESEIEKEKQIQTMKRNNLSDSEISQWFKLLDKEDFPITVKQIHDFIKSNNLKMLNTVKRGGTAVFVSKKSTDTIQLKAELLIHGIQSNKTVQEIFCKQNPNEIPKTGNNGIFITINEVTHVLISFLHNSNANSPFEIIQKNDGTLMLLKHGKPINVSLSEMHVPKWYTTQIHTVNADFSNFFVLEGERYLHIAYKSCDFNDKEKCKFCSTKRREYSDCTENNNNSKTDQMSTTNFDADKICYALGEMFEKNLISDNFHFCLGGGTYLPLQENVDFFVKIASFIRNNSRKNPIWVEMIPPSNDNISQLINAGVTSFGFNVEIWNEGLRHKVCPGKSKLTGSVDKYLSAFKFVNSKLGKNKVGSCIIVGLDEYQSIKKGIDSMTTLGVFPCVLPLKIFNDIDVELDDERMTLIERDFFNLSEYAAEEVFSNNIDFKQNEGCLNCPCCTIIHDLLIKEEL